MLYIDTYLIPMVYYIYLYFWLDFLTPTKLWLNPNPKANPKSPNGYQERKGPFFSDQNISVVIHSSPHILQWLMNNFLDQTHLSRVLDILLENVV